MTNGEKIQEIFKGCDVCEPIIEDNIIHVIFVDKNDSAIGFDWDWWNMEYKEPTPPSTLDELKELKQEIDEIDLPKELHEPCECFAFCEALEFVDNILDKKIAELEAADDCKNCPPITPHKKLAHWIGEEYDGYADGAPVYTSWVCSECGATFMCEDMDFLYCPRCGSVMEV